MMEGKTNAAIVIQAENPALEIVGRIVAEIRASYEDAFELRKKGNRRGLEIGQVIIARCRDTDVIRRLAYINSKENKPAGGTPTKIYSYLCDQIAKFAKYDAGYLRNCCLEYLAGANKVRVKGGLEPVICERKTGLLKYSGPEPFETKIDDILAAVDAPVKAPRVDNLFTLEDAEDEQVDDPVAKAARLAKHVRDFCIIKKDDGTQLFSLRNFNVVIQQLNPVVARAGYAIVRNKNQKGVKFDAKE